MVAFVTRRPSSSPVVIELGAVGSIEQDVAAWRAEIVGTSTARGLGIPDPVEGLDADVALHGSIWKPLESALDGVKTVIVSPAGPLTRVPFAALRDDAGRFLVEDRSFASIVDVRAFLAPAKKRSATPSLLVVGNVDFGGEARAHAPDRDSNERPGGRSPTRSELAQRWAATPWSPLPATAEEAGAVDVLHRRLFPEGQRLLLQGVEPAESRLKEEMERFDVVHLATHGFVAAALPGGGGATVSEYLPGLLSGVVCAGAAGRPGPAEDGYLTAEELGWLDLEGLELVALSACETGLGRSQAGESLLGLRRALAFAGADSVLSSLWAVPDRATATLMADFYRGLWEEGFAPHEALRLAQLAALGRDREAGRGDSPYAWGAFVIDGFR